MVKKKNIIIGITASISAYKALSLLRLLTREDWEIEVILTRDALNFISPLSFQALTKNRVYTDLFELIKETNPLHISLSERANLILVYPATADFISRIASGICSDLLSCVVLSTKSKVIFCPAMDEGMYLNPIIQRNIQSLKKLNYLFLGPIRGRLASGKVAWGHIIEPGEVLNKIKALLK